MHINKYNHIWLPIELGFIHVDFVIKNNDEDLFYQLQRDWENLYIH